MRLIMLVSFMLILAAVTSYASGGGAGGSGGSSGSGVNADNAAYISTLDRDSLSLVPALTVPLLSTSVPSVTHATLANPVGSDVSTAVNSQMGNDIVTKVAYKVEQAQVTPEQQEEIVNEVAGEVTENVVEDVQEQVKEEVQEQVEEDVQAGNGGQVPEEIIDAVIDEVVEQLDPNANEQQVEEMQQGIKEDIQEEFGNDVGEEVLENLIDKVVDELQGDNLDEKVDNALDDAQDELEDIVKMVVFKATYGAIPSVPCSTPGLVDVYDYTRLNSNRLKDESVRFFVSQKWLSSRKLTPQEITLNVYENGNWRAMPTKVVRENNSVVLFEAPPIASDDNIYFAIASLGRNCRITGCPESKICVQQDKVFGCIEKPVCAPCKAGEKLDEITCQCVITLSEETQRKFSPVFFAAGSFVILAFILAAGIMGRFKKSK